MADLVERIGRNVLSEAPPPVALRLRFESPKNPDEVLGRTQQVMLEVATAQAADWLCDDQWQRRLPE